MRLEEKLAPSPVCMKLAPSNNNPIRGRMGPISYPGTFFAYPNLQGATRDLWDEIERHSATWNESGCHTRAPARQRARLALVRRLYRATRPNVALKWKETDQQLIFWPYLTADFLALPGSARLLISNVTFRFYLLIHDKNVLHSY